MSDQTEHYRLEYKAENGYSSACNITIYRAIQLVIAEEIDEGQSVTNACEVIATEVVRRYDIDPQRIKEATANLAKSKAGDKVMFLNQDLFTTNISEAQC